MFCPSTVATRWRIGRVLLFPCYTLCKASGKCNPAFGINLHKLILNRKRIKNKNSRLTSFIPHVRNSLNGSHPEQDDAAQSAILDVLSAHKPSIKVAPEMYETPRDDSYNSYNFDADPSLDGAVVPSPVSVRTCSSMRTSSIGPRTLLPVPDEKGIFTITIIHAYCSKRGIFRVRKMWQRASHLLCMHTHADTMYTHTHTHIHTCIHTYPASGPTDQAPLS
jgi:hypothetical protein